MEQEKLKPIDLEVLQALYKKADEISKNLNIDYYYTLKIFNKLKKKGLCDQWVINKKKVCYINNMCKDLCAYLKALKRSKTHKKD
ncbi:hypothetical protein ACQJ7D_05865 [Helicobacter pylori]